MGGMELVQNSYRRRTHTPGRDVRSGVAAARSGGDHINRQLDNERFGEGIPLRHARPGRGRVKPAQPKPSYDRYRIADITSVSYAYANAGSDSHAKTDADANTYADASANANTNT